MIFKLIVSTHKKDNIISACIQKHKDFEEDLKQIFKFFESNIQISKKRRFRTYYMVRSDNPAIILSLFSSIQEMIPEIYFKNDNVLGKEEFIRLESY